MPYHFSHTQISHYPVGKPFLPIFYYTPFHLWPHYTGAYPCMILLKYCHNFWKSQEHISEHLYERSDYSSVFKVLESHSNKAEDIYFTEDREGIILCLLHKLALGGEEGKSIIVLVFFSNSTWTTALQITNIKYDEDLKILKNALRCSFYLNKGNIHRSYIWLVILTWKKKNSNPETSIPIPLQLFCPMTGK